MKGIKEKTAKKAVFYIYAFLSAVLVPLFLRDHYFDLIQAKSDVFRIGLLLLVFLSSAVLLFSKEEKKGKADPVCIALILFAGLAVFSSLFSDNPGGSFWGVVGWRIGSFQIAASVFLICFLKDTDIDERRLWLPLTVISDLIILLGVLHSASVDIFDLHEGILRSEYFSYLSTIGNANWLGVYLCLIFPVIFFRYLDSQGREEVFYAVSGFLCLFGLLLSNGDSAYAGLGLMSAAAIPSVLKNRKGVPFLLTAMGVSCLLVVKLPCFSLKRETLSGISAFLMKDIVIALLLVTGFLLILLRKKEIPEKVLKISVLLYRFALLLLAVFFVKGMIEAYTSFDYSWGTGRLAIWQETLYDYRVHFSLFDKFFGTGVEMQWTWYGELSERLSTWFVSSHSIPIQILFTMGCIGLAVFIVVVTLIVLRCHHRNNDTCLPCFFSLLAFLGTSLFNSADPCNFGLMILILILFLKESSEEAE